MSYSFEAVSTDYQIPLSREFNVVDLQNIHTALNDVFNHDVESELTNIDGVSEVEYNPMFGNYVHISIQKEQDNAKTKELIMTYLDEISSRYIRGNDSTRYNYVVSLSTLCDFPEGMTRENFAAVYCDNIGLELVSLEDEDLILIAANGYEPIQLTLRETKNELGEIEYVIYYVQMKHQFTITDEMTPF